MSERGQNAWRDALESGHARDFWRGVEELLDTPGLREAVAPEGVDAQSALSRRDLLRLLGATTALAGLAGCMQEPRTPILPYSSRTPESRPGQAIHYASACFVQGMAQGLLVKALDGRPLKIDGAPGHPASLGGSTIQQQALLFELYDPQRAQAPTHHGLPQPYEAFVAELAQDIPPGGAGLRFLLEPTSSPTLIDLLERIGKKYPAARTYFYSPLSPDSALEGARRATGEALQLRHDFSAAAVIVSIGADFLGSGPFMPRYSRQFADRRRLLGGAMEMNRLYVIESDLSVTGMKADHRLARKPSGVAETTRLLLRAIVEAVGTESPAIRPHLGLADATDERWFEAVAADLAKHRGKSIVLAGDEQPPEVHVLVHAMNDLLGNLGHTIRYGRSPLHRAGETAGDIEALAAELRAGAVERLVIVEGNPAYSAPADIDLPALIPKAAHTAYLGLYANATARACEWFIPISQTLERWEDGRALDGTLSFAQPLIRPLYDTHSPLEILSAFVGDAAQSDYDLMRLYWADRTPLAAAGAWEDTVQRGFVPLSAFPDEPVKTRWEEVERVLRDWPTAPAGPYELFFRPDAKILDGRFANNLWLLELADPVTKLTWDDAALISPRTAADLELAPAGCILIARGDRSVVMPTLVVPGHANETVTLPFGFGGGAKAWDGNWFANAVGIDVFPLWRSEDRTRVATAHVEKLPTTGVLAITQTHETMEGRPIALVRTLEEQRRDPDAQTTVEPLYSLYGPFDQSYPEQWGMAIDLTVCTGCSACVVACQAENNIPVVGKEGVFKSREMHWIRIDRYFTGSAAAPGVVTQPMLCQHCESAPCEYVCPVNATTHSPDGLNEMTYNRCVGTRFCQNNCPYKVRRFNWFDFNIRKPATLRMMMNPDVTVRARGVIEKCTYCVQRIRETQITTQIEGRSIRDLEVRTACQEACPSGAIMFGNLADQNAQVTHWMQEPRTYRVLESLGTRPRTRYLARITNPNPELG